MIDALLDIVGFVTGAVSFIYGTRVAWLCGRKCLFSESLENKIGMLVRNIPAATAIYLLGFLVLYGPLLENYLTWLVAAITSSIVLATVIVSMAMPELRRLPDESRSTTLISVVLKDGTFCQMDKRALNASIEKGDVLKFKRLSGWVDLETGKLRGDSEYTVFAGVDRRDIV
jgi:hypothetical protein